MKTENNDMFIVNGLTQNRTGLRFTVRFQV